MTESRKLEEVQFYLDRSQDAVLAVLRSIVGNPRLQNSEGLTALKMMGDFHHRVADFIQQKICEGEEKGRVLAAEYNIGKPEGCVAEPTPETA